MIVNSDVVDVYTR